MKKQKPKYKRKASCVGKNRISQHYRFVRAYNRNREIAQLNKLIERFPQKKKVYDALIQNIRKKFVLGVPFHKLFKEAPISYTSFGSTPTSRLM